MYYSDWDHAHASPPLPLTQDFRRRGLLHPDSASGSGTENAQRTIVRIGLAIAITAVIARIVFWRYTGRVWEDALITILHAENALAGLGLTHFKPDEPPIHGFTSPLSVLIPLLGEWLRTGFALNFMRLASLATAFFSVFVAARIALAIPELGLTPPLVTLVCGYLAFEHHQTLWGMAGMETQVVVCVLLLSILCLALRNYVALGLALGLCLLARPDLALWVAIVGVYLLLEAFRSRRWRPLGVTIAVSMAVYLPWILFAWAYYGSPIPNTILAKSAGYAYWWRRESSLGFWLSGAWFQARVSVLPSLGPTFAGNGTNFSRLFDPGWAWGIMSGAILVGFVGACLKRSRRVLVLYAFFWVYLAYFVFLVPTVFSWYIAPFMAVAVMLAAHGLGVAWAVPPRWGSTLAWFATVAYLAAIVGVLPQTYRGERNIQRLVEEPVRIAIGKYLRDTAPSNATVGGEPLGYIGYYSRLAYYDYPGLASRRVVELLRRTDDPNLFEILKGIRPDYVVLRDSDLDAWPGMHPWLAAGYRLERRFEVVPSDRAKLLLPERNVDLAFTVFRRQERSAPTTANRP